ncbi:hypothetical protein ACL90Y_08395 [Micrococcus luteus]
MSTHRRRRHAAHLTGSALLLAAALTLTACQQAETDGAGEESEKTSTASVSPSGSEGSGSEGAEPSDAQISASAVPDHLLPPDDEATQAMIKALEKTMGRPVASVKSGTVADHERDAQEALRLVEDPNVTPMDSERCRADLVARAQAFAAATAQNTRFSGERPQVGGDGETVSDPYLVQVFTFEDAAGAEQYVRASLTVQDNEECAGEPVLGAAGSGHEEHRWGEGARYTMKGGSDDGRGGVFVSTLAVDGNHVLTITDSPAPDEEPADALDRHAKAVDALAQVLGEPLRG